MSNLFSPLDVGSTKVSSRIVMAPMTRCRSSQPGDIPNEMMAAYYAQRAGAGLIITEATQISPQGKGYSFTPGIYSKEQIAGWKIITNAVHSKGGKIYNQLWHVGRMSHPIFHNGELPVAPSAVAFEGQVWIYDEQKQKGEKVSCPIPRELTIAEIKSIIKDYQRAVVNAMEAGFDGVEIHGANGYLIEQFLRTTSNQRTDEYGGSIENRLRFLKEVVTVVVDAIGADKVGIRLAPFITARGMNCPEILPCILEAANFLQSKNVSYIHLAEADWDDAPKVDEDFRRELRKGFHGKIIVAGKFTKERAEQILAQGYADLVAFGRPFIANPDFPARLKNNLALATLDPNTLFGGTERGYSDYPVAI
ncbi:alkene reductase [Cellvibrio zantedeschiae]|uniref:Alkene reductase n=1 Tax=Cellvibrio zantedeschiae TaxID=1237077 RepID=A0ABQ3AXR6_9GAMM|nr:alkene reductase [Cellvibrio zantedeschiae]GGY71146.1 alkene reductase [Cellvibrio zantedeschiae]